MLNSQLIDIINSGNAWAFVGSGCSADAGFPLWEELLELTLKEAALREGDLQPAEANLMAAHQKSNDLPKAFSVLKAHYGSGTIDAIVSQFFQQEIAPGLVTTILTSWPFAAYATTNYDHLLEEGLKLHGGWVSVGNNADENRKISGDVRSVVWHPHGGARLGNKNSRLVVSQTDYDEIYSAGSPTLSALKALFRMRSIVFVGFGFRDPDLLITLERVGRLVTPSRPAFAFLANCDQRKRDEYWSKYMVEVIPYRAKGRDHSDLGRVLSSYGLFILSRNTRFAGQAQTPDYDMPTVGLLSHNRLLRSGWQAEGGALRSVARSFLLAQLYTKGRISLEELKSSHNLPAYTKGIIDTVASELTSQDILVEHESKIQLTPKGLDYVGDGKAGFELVRDQFYASVASRLSHAISDTVQLQNAQAVTINYLDRACQDRGLGVAQQLGETGDVDNRARAVALLQGAKEELNGATDREAALASIHCIWDILTSPRQEERQYLGFMTQAYFGRQMLSADPGATAAQLRNLQSTIFIADSNFLIPLLARGSVGNSYATRLAQCLSRAGCHLVTSNLLLEECVEHARWAWRLLDENGSTSAITLDAARGARGYRPNAFLSGYLCDPKFGPGASFKSYFGDILSSDGTLPDVETVARSLRQRAVVVQGFSDWSGFTQTLWADLDQVFQTIEARRKSNNTYKHDRQVRAEAEVAIIITGVRLHQLRLDDHETRDAFFLSHSRVVDNLPGLAHRICIRPESLHEWLTSIGEVTVDDATAIFDQLLWELNREGIDVVPRGQLLRLFHNTIDLSKEHFGEIISEHREFIREYYAQDPQQAFGDIDPLLIPSAAVVVTSEVLAEMKKAIVEEQRKRVRAEAKAKTALKDAAEYERLKEEKRQRQQKAKKQRARSSSRKRGRKK